MFACEDDYLDAPIANRKALLTKRHGISGAVYDKQHPEIVRAIAYQLRNPPNQRTPGQTVDSELARALLSAGSTTVTDLYRSAFETEQLVAADVAIRSLRGAKWEADPWIYGREDRRLTATAAAHCHFLVDITRAPFLSDLSGDDQSLTILSRSAELAFSAGPFERLRAAASLYCFHAEEGTYASIINYHSALDAWRWWYCAAKKFGAYDDGRRLIIIGILAVAAREVVDTLVSHGTKTAFRAAAHALRDKILAAEDTLDQRTLLKATELAQVTLSSNREALLERALNGEDVTKAILDGNY